MQQAILSEVAQFIQLIISIPSIFALANFYLRAFKKAQYDRQRNTPGIFGFFRFQRT